MGEYANYLGESIKIGTCEDMYYLRAEQAGMVTPLPGSLDPVMDAEALRFRFPFIDEDGLDPGSFDEYNKGLRLDIRLDMNHLTIQLKGSKGYLISIPCPEQLGEDIPKTMILEGLGEVYLGRNGYAGSIELRGQAFRGDSGLLVPVIGCIQCGSMVSLPDKGEAAPILDYLDAEAKKYQRQAATDKPELAPGWTRRANECLEIASRILKGYETTLDEWQKIQLNKRNLLEVTNA